MKPSIRKDNTWIFHIAILFFITVAICFWNTRQNYLQKQKNTLQLLEMSEIKINPLIELDFKSKEEIYEIRKEYVRQHKELLSVDYQPSEAVFGQIEDNRPWWGILGLCYYGDGPYSTEGMSKRVAFFSQSIFAGVLIRCECAQSPR